MSDFERNGEKIEVTFYGSDHEWPELERPRPLSEWERAAVVRMVQGDATLQGVGQRQAIAAVVTSACRDCPSVGLRIEGDIPTLHSVMGLDEPRFGAADPTLHGKDEDGMFIELVLHIQEGYLAELEVIRYDNEPIRRLPPVEEFEPAPFDQPHSIGGEPHLGEEG